MASINVPTGTPTITANTAEGCLFQALRLAGSLELNAAKNPSLKEYITGQTDIDRSEFRGTATFEFSPTRQIDGTTKISILEYLLETGFAAGSGGTFRSQTLGAYIWEVAHFLIETQTDTTKNPNQKFLISASLDYGTVPFTGTLRYALPVQAVLTAGGFIQESAVAYLL